MNLMKPSDLASVKSERGREWLKSVPPVESADEYREWRLRHDPKFFSKKLLKIITKGRIIPLELRIQQEMLANIVLAMKIAKLPVRIIVLKARRQGFSTMVEALAAQEAMLRPFRKAKIVAHKDESAQYIFEMARTFHDELHPVVKPLKRYSTKRELSFENPDDKTRPQKPGLRSKITIATAGGKGVGRGEEVTFLHLSEVGFYDDAAELATGLFSTVDELADTSIFMESTANGVGNYFHDQYWKHKNGKEELLDNLRRDYEDIDKLVSHLESFQGNIGFLPLFFPWHEFADYQMPIPSQNERDLLMETLDEEELELVRRYHLTPEQLKWRRARIDQYSQTAEGISPIELFKQEYPASDIEAFIATGSGVFDASALSELDQHRHAKLWQGRFLPENPRYRRDGRYKPRLMQHPFGELTIYKPPKRGHQYAIGGDTALGFEGSDFSCLQVLDKQTLEQVAEWHGKIDPDLLGKFSMMLGVFYNNATIGIERNAMGTTAIVALRDTLYPYIYVGKDYARAKGENPLDLLGFFTSKDSKARIIGNMAEVIRTKRLLINSPQLIQECLAYKRDEKGKMGAEDGKHDDRVIAMEITYQVVVDYPFVIKRSTIGEILRRDTSRGYMISRVPASDPELGDIMP